MQYIHYLHYPFFQHEVDIGRGAPLAPAVVRHPTVLRRSSLNEALIPFANNTVYVGIRAVAVK